jgi:hypothetical protein
MKTGQADLGRELTEWQKKALKRLEKTSPEAKVIGYDTSCDGPLIRLDEGFTVAITPRGRTIERNPA